MIIWHMQAWSAAGAAANIYGPRPSWFPVPGSQRQGSPGELTSPGHPLSAHHFLIGQETYPVACLSNQRRYSHA